MSRDATQSRFVSVAAQPTYHADRLPCKHEPVAFWFARVNVGQVYFDVRNRHRSEGVAQRNARMRVRAGVDDRAIRRPVQTLNLSHKLPLAVGLEEAERHVQLGRDFGERCLYLRQRLAPIDRGFADAEHVEVRAVDDGDT